ncbi:MAG: hypothetical protein JXB60_01375 [Candidatus Cloacimonetes bacterium]|nr:hypothetical protein [Candidatus Cloacimonadota bacterium]
MKYFSLFFLAIISTALTANSIFSFSGMPYRYYGCDVYSMGMGETGISDLFRINTDYYNPANAVSTNQVTFATGIGMGYIWYLDNASNSYRDDGLYFPYFVIAVPLGNHKIAFSVNTISSGILENQGTNFWNGYAYEEINKISANIYKADLIYAFKNRIMNIGLAANYYIGHRIRYWELDFVSSTLNDVKYELDREFKNPGFSFGLNKKFGNLAIGMTYSTASELEEEIEFNYYHPPYTDIIEHDYTFMLPSQFSGGLTWRFLSKYKTSFDIYYEKWSETDTYEKDTFKYSWGIAYDPLSGYGEWYEQIPLRLGAYWRELPFTENGNDIYEKAVTAGISIPLKSPGKQIDLSGKYMVRGNLTDNGMRDRSIFFYVGISGFDIFSKRQRMIEHRDIPEAEN